MSFSVSHLRLRIFVVIIAMFLLWQTLKLLPWLLAVQTVDGDSVQPPERRAAPVLVSVFYEALCPDSRSFITKQLLPSLLKSPRSMLVDLVPYGKAETFEDSSGNISFSCQHGQLECQANKIHACSTRYITDTGLLTKYVSCMISNNMNPEYIAEECAKELSLDAGPILRCSKSKLGSELLKSFGVRTSESVPGISFVPTVLLNNEFGRQADILKNLHEQVIKMEGRNY